MPGVVALAERFADERFDEFHAGGDRAAQFARAVDEDSALLFPMPAIAEADGVFHSRILETGDRGHEEEGLGTRGEGRGTRD